MTKSIVLYDPIVAGIYGPELARLQDALADVEVFIYESWEFDGTLTKDAARRFVRIADIFGWTMPWVEEMREFAL